MIADFVVVGGALFNAFEESRNRNHFIRFGSQK
jgi:hypothetical protein